MSIRNKTLNIVKYTIGFTGAAVVGAVGIYYVPLKVVCKATEVGLGVVMNVTVDLMEHVDSFKEPEADAKVV